MGLLQEVRLVSGPTNLGGITTQGDTHARALLVQSAWSIVRARSSTNPLKRWGVVRCAAARPRRGTYGEVLRARGWP